MPITGVTFTGADDGVSPAQLLSVSRQYPFVEWGILFSRSKQPSPRYPSVGWLISLLETYEEAIRPLGPLEERVPFVLSAHLCGSYARDFAEGGRLWWRNFGVLCDMFDRVQLNIGGATEPRTTTIAAAGHIRQLQGSRFVIQAGPVNRGEALHACARLENASVLFDNSGGRGELPAEWPSALPGRPCGYAGGLTPENVGEQFGRIALASEHSGAEVWLDMESGVRTSDGSGLDIERVLAVCRKVAPLMGRQVAVPDGGGR